MVSASHLASFRCDARRRRDLPIPNGKRFVVHADEKLTAFVELEAAIRRAMATTTA
jgi:hypothetical protein